MAVRFAGKLAGIFNRHSVPASQVAPETMVELGGRMYPLSQAERAYKKLTLPKIPEFEERKVFYRDDRAIGTIEPDGEVRFYTQWDELNKPRTFTDWLFRRESKTPGGWSLQSPSELGEEQVSDPPTNEVRQLLRTFNNQLIYKGKIQRTGAGLYYNVPISPERADLYRRRVGFIDANPVDSNELFQVRSNRRFAGNPTIAQLYILGDAGHLKNPVAAQILREQLLDRHPYLREIIDQQLRDGTPFGPPDIPSTSMPDTYSLLERKRQFLDSFLRALGK